MADPSRRDGCRACHLGDPLAGRTSDHSPLDGSSLSPGRQRPLRHGAKTSGTVGSESVVERHREVTPHTFLPAVRHNELIGPHCKPRLKNCAAAP